MKVSQYLKENLQMVPQYQNSVIFEMLRIII